MSDFNESSAEFESGLGVASFQSSSAQEITDIEIKFDESSQTQSKRLYGNKRMQVRVLVQVKGKGIEWPKLAWNGITLIHYNSNQPIPVLDPFGKHPNGWAVSRYPNDFAHSISTGSGGVSANSLAADDLSASNSQMALLDVGTSNDGTTSLAFEFWISCGRTDTTQLGVQIRLNNGRVISSNRPGTPGHFDSSITLEALRPPKYPSQQFTFKRERVGGEYERHQIYRYQLGLYPNGNAQIPLLSWSAERYEEVFNRHARIYVSGRMNNGRVSYAESYLAFYKANFLGFSFPGSPSRYYNVEVNKHAGEFSVIHALTPNGYFNGSAKQAPFHFSVTDIYGNEHDLVIQADDYGQQLILI